VQTPETSKFRIFLVDTGFPWPSRDSPAFLRTAGRLFFGNSPAAVSTGRGGVHFFDFERRFPEIAARTDIHSNASQIFPSQFQKGETQLLHFISLESPRRAMDPPPASVAPALGASEPIDVAAPDAPAPMRD